MITTKMCLPRRLFLRGLGATLALPLLDSMVPALAAATVKAPRRLAVVYAPNGIIMDRWTPAAEGALFAWTPVLEPLAPVRDQVLVLSVLCDTPRGRRPRGAD